MRSPQLPRPTNSRRTRSEAGFSLLEIMVALMILAIGLLTQVTTTMGEHRLSVEERFRSNALQAADQLLQRLRADEDWAGLYARLRARQEQAAMPGALATGEVRLDDGRRAYLPQAYYPDFVLPPLLTEAHVLFEVPSALLDDQPEAGPVLREDVVAARFGLPADLDLDGALDGGGKDGDYLLLPVRMVLRWAVQGEAPREFVLLAWIRGAR